MPSLEQLSLNGCAWSDRALTGSQNTLRWVVSNLSALPKCLQLSRLTLLLTIDDFPSAPDVGFEKAGWGDLVKVVEGLAQKLDICIRISVVGRHGSYVEDFLKERLSRLVSLQVLFVDRV